VTVDFFPSPLSFLRMASRIVDPASIRWIGFSHFESDECGSMNEWRVAEMKEVLGKDE